MISRQMGFTVDLKGKKVSELNVDEFFDLCYLVFQHGVICVKKQDLDLGQEFIPTISKLGEAITVPPEFIYNNTQPNMPQISRIGNVKADGTMVQGFQGFEKWHQDGDFWGFPKSFIVNWLLADKIPDSGGETGFIDLMGAYEQLEEGMKRKLENGYYSVSVKDIHDFKYQNPGKLGLPDRVYHKSVQTHPIIQKKHLYLGFYFNNITLDDETEISITELIDDIASKPDLFYMHKYEPGDLLIWDNTSTMHRGMGGYFDQPRLLYRGQSAMTKFHQDIFNRIHRKE
ncbi:hypothetical protein pb186bvf_003298 [Paramecium bursaria]